MKIFWITTAFLVSLWALPVDAATQCALVGGAATNIPCTPQQFGAVADGGNHPLSSYYGSLAAAQAVYPFVTSLTQQIDYAALKEMSNTALGPDGSEHGTTSPQLNMPIVLPCGKYNLGNDSWRIYRADGIDIEGTGTTCVTLASNGIVLLFDGLWYSKLSSFEAVTSASTASFTGTITGTALAASSVTGGFAVGQTIYNGATPIAQIVALTATGTGGAGTYTVFPSQSLGATALTATTPDAVDIDGNTGVNGTTIGVQANSLFDLVWVGIGAQYGFGMCRQGSSSGQCSENVFYNPHGQGGSFATYYQIGSNAISNEFIGGDMQNFATNGVWLGGGSIKLFSTSFESTHGYTQILNGGCDINASNGGSEESIVVYGVRSESFCVYLGQWSQWADLRGVRQLPGGWRVWGAGQLYSLNDVIKETDTAGFDHMYRVTTAGTSGSSQPTWPTSGTVSDGSVVWTMTPYTAISINEGAIDLNTSYIDTSATIVNGVVPATSSCGSGSPTPVAGSRRNYGQITEGSGATGCTIALNFWQQTPTPICTVTSPNGSTITSWSVTNTGVTNSLVIVNPTPGTFVWQCRQ